MHTESVQEPTAIGLLDQGVPLPSAPRSSARGFVLAILALNLLGLVLLAAGYGPDLVDMVFEGWPIYR